MAFFIIFAARLGSVTVRYPATSSSAVKLQHDALDDASQVQYAFRIPDSRHLFVFRTSQAPIESVFPIKVLTRAWVC